MENNGKNKKNPTPLHPLPKRKRKNLGPLGAWRLTSLFARIFFSFLAYLCSLSFLA
jgi:hypothetical protein